jgi:Secretion system C-terminal sorting domain
LNNQFGQPVYDKYDMSSTGIELAVSQNCLVLNNSTEETVIGMNILGICDHPNSPYGSNNHIRGNTFNQPHNISETPKLNNVDLVGLLIGADSYCGNQDCTGNEWYGEYVNGAKCLGNPLQSPFIVPVDAPPVMPPNVLPASGWFGAAACRPEGRNVSMGNMPASEDEFQNIRVHIYPNPAENYLKLLIPEASEFACTIRITNLAGKLILKKHIHLGSKESILDIKDLKTGMYLVQIVSGMIQQTEKVIVVK